MHDFDSLENLSSLEAEQFVLGGLIQNGTLFDDVFEIITHKDFYFAKSRRIFLALESLAADSQTIDVITIAEKHVNMTGDDVLEYLSDLSENAVSANLTAYAEIIKDKAVKRNLVSVAICIHRNVCSTPDQKASDAIEYAQKEIMQLEEKQSDSLDVVHVNQAIKQVINNMELRWKEGDKLNGYSSGLVGIDNRVNGWKDSNLIIIAGRPSMGKSTYALQIALDIWYRQNLNGLFFSCEMSVSELTEKALACIGKIPLSLIQKPTDKFWDSYSPHLQAAAGHLKDRRMNLIDCPGIHINQIKSYARKAHKRDKLNFIVVDHIGLVGGDGKSTNDRVASVTMGLKQIAKELNIVVFGLAQLNRSVEQRANKRPQVSDLRDSGSIEQDADIIQFLYRDEYYKDDESMSHPNDGLLEINTAKFRNGKRGTDYFQCHLDQSRIEDTNRTVIREQPKNVSNIRSRL